MNERMEGQTDVQTNEPSEQVPRQDTCSRKSAAVKEPRSRPPLGRTMFLKREKRRSRSLIGQNAFANENLRHGFPVSMSQYAHSNS